LSIGSNLPTSLYTSATGRLGQPTTVGLDGQLKSAASSFGIGAARQAVVGFERSMSPLERTLAVLNALDNAGMMVG
jgi:hypothetical protein